MCDGFMIGGTDLFRRWESWCDSLKRPLKAVDLGQEQAPTAWPTSTALTLAVIGALAMGTALPFWLVQLAQQAARMMWEITGYGGSAEPHIIVQGSAL